MTRSHGRRNDEQDSRGSCSGCLRLRRPLLFLLHDELEQLLQKRAKKVKKTPTMEQILQNNFNTSYLTDWYNIFTPKMESESKNTIFGLKMMVKRGARDFGIPPDGKVVIFITKFVILGILWSKRM